MNYDTHKYFLNFIMAHTSESSSPTKLCIEFSSDKTFDIETKEIGRRCIPFRNVLNYNFPQDFYCASNFLDSTKSSTFRTPPTLIPLLDQYILM